MKSPAVTFISSCQRNCWFSILKQSKTPAQKRQQSMATLAPSSSSPIFSGPSSKLSQPSLSSSSRLSLSSFSQLSPLSSSLSISPSFSAYPTCSRRLFASSFPVKASAAEKKKILIVNTNSGGHAVIGFYFAKELLGSGHEVSILTVGEESSDKMKKPPFSRFSVSSKNQYIQILVDYDLGNYLLSFGFWNFYGGLVFAFEGNCGCWREDGMGEPSRGREGCGRSNI